MQDPPLMRPAAGRLRDGRLRITVAVALATSLLVSGAVQGQESPAVTPTIGASQASNAPDSPPPSGPPTEAPVTATVPVETATSVPSQQPTDVPPTATVPPTEAPTVTPPPATQTPGIGPTIAPTETSIVAPPTELPPEAPTTAPDVVTPDQGQDATSPGGSITLTDRFDDPSTRLLGETDRNDSLIMGRYQDGGYRLAIEGPEVAPDLIAFVRSPILGDVTIHVNAHLEGTTESRYVMATCREVAGYGGYRAYLSPTDGFFAITRFTPGAVPTPLQQGFADELIQGNEAFDFDFSCSGSVLELGVNGETIGIAADNAFAAGTISIGTGFFVNAETGPVSAVFQELDVSGDVAMTGSVAHGRRAEIGRNQRLVGTLPALSPTG